jgi:ABC-type nitrate/sulfonate/bicarbonate transport system substrate-binding protein
MTAEVVKTLWYTRCPVPTASGLAIALHLFRDEFAPDGIEVQSLRASRSRSVRESHFDHQQENCFRQGGNIPPLWSRSLGADTALIGLTWVDEYQAVIALPESGIKTVRDLRGRRIGVSVRKNDRIDFFRAMCLRTLHGALRLGDLSPEDVDVVPIPVEENYLGDIDTSRTGQLWAGGTRARRQKCEMFALVRGQVDAICTSGAAGAQLRESIGAADVVELGFHPDRALRGGNQGPAALTVSAKLLRERPDLVERYLKQVVRAARWAETHRREAIQVFADEVGTACEWADLAYGANAHLNLCPTLDDDMVRGLETQKRFLLQHGFMDSDVDIGKWMVRSPLERVMQELRVVD